MNKRRTRTWAKQTFTSVEPVDSSSLPNLQWSHSREVSHVDEIEYSNSKRVGSNDCRHYSIESVEHYPDVVLEGGPHEFYIPGETPDSPIAIGSGYIRSNDIAFRALGYLGDGISDSLYLIESSFDWNKWNERACRAMQPKVPELLSIGNFLYELKDFKSLFGFYRREIPKWKKYLSRLKTKKDTLAQHGIGPLNKSLSEIHLQYQLGLAPFASDVKKLLEASNITRKAMIKFFQEAGTLQVKHWSREFDSRDTDVVPVVDLGDRKFDSDIEVSGWTFSSPLGTDVYVKGIKVRPVKLKYSATLVYIYRCENLASRYRELMFLLDTFGVNWDPATIWNALPFSFIVDWFLDVGNWLESCYQAQWMKVDVDVVDFCHSIKCNPFIVEGWVYPPLHREVVPGWFTPVAPLHVVREGKFYRRRVELPRFVESLRGGGGLNAGRILTSLSMANTRKRPKTSVPSGN